MMRKLVLTLIALIAAVTLARSLDIPLNDVSLNAAEYPEELRAASLTADAPSWE
jgi:hypothetical protein